MLETIGVSSIDDLFADIPESARLKPRGDSPTALSLAPGLDELSLMREVAALSERNSAARALSFLGAGMYDHHIPPAVDQLLLRSEYYTAYTPYQAEVAQGTLQAIFEFQTLVCDLYGMEVANASMYDAASATAEAALMARRVSKKRKCIVSEAVHPDYRATLLTYLGGLDGEPDVTWIPVDASGRTDHQALRAALTDDTAAVIVQQPNYLGCIEDLTAVRAASSEAILVVANAEPYAFSLIKSPGSLGADITVGEGQGLAVPPQLGGPGVGLFACRQKHVRQMPGRLVGETVDADGERGFVLTLSTREQHIRRERATSNICTNHGLVALAFAIRTAMLGRQGYEATGRRCLDNAEYLKGRISALSDFDIPVTAPTFNEFPVRYRNDVGELLASLRERGVLAGVPLASVGRDDQFLVAVTEKHTREDLDKLASALGGA